MKFEEWLGTQGLAHSSILKYAGAIDGPLTDWGTQHAILHAPLRTINDPHEFAALAELIENTDIFIERNKRGNSMYGAALNNYIRYLTATIPTQEIGALGRFSEKLTQLEKAVATELPFDPKGHVDARMRGLRDVVRRQGQPKFRKSLIAAYEGKCAVSGCSLLPILEAAHITPFLGPATNLVSNGLLLRADIHTLWDLGLIAVNPSTMLVAVNELAHDATYKSFAEVPIFQPDVAAFRASPAALAHQWAIFNGDITI